MAETKTRQSNFELLRIIAILEIIGSHYIVHGAGCGSSLLSRLFFNSGLFSNGQVGVAVFVLISGWFLEQASFTWKKVFKLFGEVLFYSLLNLTICWLVHPEIIDARNLLISVFPISSATYWFASNFIVAYCFTPFIRTSLTYFHANWKTYKNFIFVCASCFVGLGLVTPFNSIVGNLVWFIFLFYLGDFIRVLNQRTNISTGKILLAFLCAKIVEWLFLLVINALANEMPKIATFSEHLTGRYSVGTLVEAVALILLFSRLNIKSKLINNIASCTFGIYLLTDHPLNRSLIWFDILKTNKFVGSTQILHYLICILVLFIVGTLIDVARKESIEKVWMSLTGEKQ